ncbi:MAG: sensor histidine kinase [Bacteroidota bacterium]
MIFWTVIYFLWAFMKSSGGRFFSTYLLVNLVNVPLYMAAYYLLKHVQLPKLYNRDKLVLFGISLLLSSIVFYTIWRVAGALRLDELRGLKGRMRFMSLADYLIQTVQFYSPSMALLAWELHHERQRELQRIHQLEKEKITTELKFLKAQLNPHFLFNTLNNLYSFVVNGSPKAPDMILRLSGILDYVLYRSQRQEVQLKEEITTIEHFINLEQIRYGERLVVEFEKSGNLTRSISPLLLLSLVENAFKHGASGDVDQPRIIIKIKGMEDAVYCTVWNTKSKYQGELNDAYKEGIGLSNIKRQLNLLYPETHQLMIEDEANYFKVGVTISPENA